MYEHGLISELECMDRNTPKLIPNNVWGQDKKIKDMPLKEALFLYKSNTCREAIDLMKSKAFD